LVLCVIAFVVLAFMSLFSAKYRPLAKDAFRCVFLKMTLRPCESGLDQKIKMSIVSKAFDKSPPLAKFINTHFELLSWIFVILTLASFVLVLQGLYNIYLYGTCDPVHPEQCLVSGMLGKIPICPSSFDGITVGPANAKVQIIEFGCFTCPYTKSSETAVRKILTEYNGSVQYIFKTYPIPTHDHSVDAAAASICANNQGRYWDYREAMFNNQSRISSEGRPYLVSLAYGLGLDVPLFSSCLSDNATAQQVSQMQEEGIQSNIYGTPAFFVNHKYVEANFLEQAVKDALAK
jgi:hypothetical protein